MILLKNNSVLLILFVLLSGFLIINSCVYDSSSGSSKKAVEGETSKATIGFIGCSNTRQTVYGYRWANGKNMWLVDRDDIHDYDSGAVIQWAESQGDFWDVFDKNLAKNPRTTKIWWQLCLPRDQAGITYEEALPVIDELRKRIPNVSIYVSPLAEYTENGHIRNAFS